METTFNAWKDSAAVTRARLSRLIRNCGRLDDATFQALLGKIDRAIARDTLLLEMALAQDLTI